MTTGRIVLPALLAASLFAQTTPSNIGPTPPPLVNADLSVTYFLNAPNAHEVLLADTAVSPGPPGRPLTKGPDGMWSVTTPPYEPGTHYYNFLIDGVLTGDLGGTAVTDRLSRGFLLFESIDVRGPEPLFTDIRKVPHGTVHVETFSSATLDREVRCLVYTPPGFVGRERLPIVYLLHGDLQDASAWSLTGYAERIADNLIADGQARRIILAMPDTGTSNRRNLAADAVESYLISEVIPFVETKYLGEPSSERYLAGLSAGAGHTRYTGLRNPALFAGLGLFSGGGLAAGMVLEQLYPTLLQPELYRQMKPVFIAVGADDSALGNVRRISESLDRLGIPNRLSVTSGGHVWFNWRRYFAEFLKGI
jgi:enterochelin esterase family protein